MEHSRIIIGVGSAGSVLANRLSARSGNRVLLLEAGPDTPPARVPKEIEDAYPGAAYFDPRFHWTGLKVRTGSCPTTTGTRRRHGSGNTCRRGCWAAAPRSTGGWRSGPA